MRLDAEIVEHGGETGIGGVLGPNRIAARQQDPARHIETLLGARCDDHLFRLAMDGPRTADVFGNGEAQLEQAHWIMITRGSCLSRCAQAIAEAAPIVVGRDAGCRD